MIHNEIDALTPPHPDRLSPDELRRWYSYYRDMVLEIRSPKRFWNFTPKQSAIVRAIRQAQYGLIAERIADLVGSTEESVVVHITRIKKQLPDHIRLKRERGYRQPYYFEPEGKAWVDEAMGARGPTVN